MGWPQNTISGMPACGEAPVSNGSFTLKLSGAESDLTVVSLNMARESRRDRIIADMKQSSVFETADVWLLQEAVQVVPQLAQTLGLHWAYAPADTMDDGQVSGLAILSRYPLKDAERISLPQYNLRFRSRCRIALSATVARPGGAVRLLNVHLDTRITQSQRLEQAAAILKQDMTSLPVIIGGDFNTANVRWVGNILPLPLAQNHTQAVRDLFLNEGFDSPLDNAGRTFKLLGLPLQLDWIFSKRLRAVKAGTEDIAFSDHHAVWVYLQD